jgi:hypothetical protein
VSEIGKHEVEEMRTLKSVDTSAEERFYNRSKRIRKKIYNFIRENVGQRFEDFEDMCNQAANYAKCSPVTSGRWIKVYTAPNGDFGITADFVFYIKSDEV